MASAATRTRGGKGLPFCNGPKRAARTASNAPRAVAKEASGGKDEQRGIPPRPALRGHKGTEPYPPAARRRVRGRVFLTATARPDRRERSGRRRLKTPAKTAGIQCHVLSRMIASHIITRTAPTRSFNLMVSVHNKPTRYKVQLDRANKTPRHSRLQQHCALAQRHPHWPQPHWPHPHWPNRTGPTALALALAPTRPIQPADRPKSRVAKPVGSAVIQRMRQGSAAAAQTPTGTLLLRERGNERGNGWKAGITKPPGWEAHVSWNIQ